MGLAIASQRRGVREGKMARKSRRRQASRDVHTHDYEAGAVGLSIDHNEKKSIKQDLSLFMCIDRIGLSRYLFGIPSEAFRLLICRSVQGIS